MLFRQIFLAKGLSHLENFAEHPERKMTLSRTAGTITILLRNPTSDEQSTNKWREHDVICETIAERKPTEKLLKLFGMVSRREIPEGVDRSWIGPKGTIDEEGRISSIGLLQMESYSKAFADYYRELSKELANVTSKVISTLRWRLNLEQGPRAVQRTLFSDTFSFDGIEWFHLPSDFHSTAMMLVRRAIPDSLLTEITNFVQAGQEEPLPHALFREAWSLRSSNPRSALLIGVAAAEVAVKSYIARVAPETRWLVENLASPPIDKIMREYIPNLPRQVPEGSLNEIPAGVIDELKKAVTLRNKVAHTGEYSLSHPSLEAKLQVIRDLLWILDYFSGRLWALANVRIESRTSAIAPK